MATPESRLDELGMTLPAPPPPVAAYAPTARLGSTLYVSGQLPLDDGSLLHTGRVGDRVSLDEAVACARQCAIMVLAQLRQAAGSLDHVRIVRLGVFVASATSFIEQHKVADGASSFLSDVFGTDRPHARFAVGVTALPLDAPVEVEAIAEMVSG